MLDENEVNELCIEVFSILPDSYFYQPEIVGGEYARLRSVIEEQRRKLRFPAFEHDQNEKRKLNIYNRNYKEALEILASQKRSDILLELFTRTPQARLDYIEKVVNKAGIKKYISVIRELRI